MQWIHLGANDWTGSQPTAATATPTGRAARTTPATLGQAMPGFDLSAEELAAVTRYVRETLSGGPDETEIVTEELAQEAIDEADEGEIIYKNAEPDPERVEAATAEGGWRSSVH